MRGSVGGEGGPLAGKVRDDRSGRFARPQAVPHCKKAANFHGVCVC